MEGADSRQITVGKAGRGRAGQHERTCENKAEDSHLTVSAFRLPALSAVVAGNGHTQTEFRPFCAASGKWFRWRRELFRCLPRTKRSVQESRFGGCAGARCRQAASIRRNSFCINEIRRLVKFYLLKRRHSPAPRGVMQLRGGPASCNIVVFTGQRLMAHKDRITRHSGSRTSSEKESHATPMAQQRRDPGASSAPQMLLQLVGCHDASARGDRAPRPRQTSKPSRPRH